MEAAILLSDKYLWVKFYPSTPGPDGCSLNHEYFSLIEKREKFFALRKNKAAKPPQSPEA